MKGYFDVLCASKESQLYGAPVMVADNDEVRKLRQALAETPDDGGLYIQLGDALSYQLRFIEAISAYPSAIGKLPESMAGYQKRGGRYLTTLQLPRAYELRSLSRRYIA
jgi:tetratricopeptide (TPR) repeat protein